METLFDDSEIVFDCPFDKRCQYVNKEDGKIHRCRFYTKIVGKNPQSEETVDRWDCAIAWLPILQVEVAQTNRGQTAAIESFRNEMVKLNSAPAFGLTSGAENNSGIKKLKGMF